MAIAIISIFMLFLLGVFGIIMLIPAKRKDMLLKVSELFEFVSGLNQSIFHMLPSQILAIIIGIIFLGVGGILYNNNMVIASILISIGCSIVAAALMMKLLYEKVTSYETNMGLKFVGDKDTFGQDNKWDRWLKKSNRCGEIIIIGQKNSKWAENSSNTIANILDRGIEKIKFIFFDYNKEELENNINIFKENIIKIIGQNKFNEYFEDKKKLQIAKILYGRIPNKIMNSWRQRNILSALLEKEYITQDGCIRNKIDYCSSYDKIEIVVSVETKREIYDTLKGYKRLGSGFGYYWNGKLFIVKLYTGRFLNEGAPIIGFNVAFASPCFVPSDFEEHIKYLCPYPETKILQGFIFEFKSMIEKAEECH